MAIQYKVPQTAEDYNSMDNRGDTSSNNFTPFIREDIEIFTPEDGANVIRLVPPLAEDRHADFWGLQVRMYSNLSSGILLAT